MDSKLMSKILKEKKIKISEIPDDFDIDDLPSDVEVILDEDFPELEDCFWEEDDEQPPSVRKWPAVFCGRMMKCVKCCGILFSNSGHAGLFESIISRDGGRAGYYYKGGMIK